MFGGPLVKVGGYAISLALNFGLYLAAFRFLTASVVPTRCLWLGRGRRCGVPGDPPLVGSIYVKHVVSHARETYGTSPR